MSFTSVNPATGEVVAEFASHTPEQIEAALALSAATFRSWRQTPFADRGALMNAAATILEDEVVEIGAMLTGEMGKTHAQAQGEVLKCAKTMRYYAEHAEAMLATEIIASPASHSGVRYEPLGVVFAIMPWNFPLWQVVRMAAGTLMAGNAVAVKHAPNVPGCALYLQDLFRRAGAPRGVMTNLFVELDQVPSVIADDRVAAVTITGSETAGQIVASQAGSALKKCVLELGGSDAFIVAGSADMAVTVPAAVTARIQNNGQSCIASKRFIVVRERADEFIDAFTAAMGQVTVGDPMDPASGMGPLVSQEQREQLHAQVQDSVAKGAVVRTGGTMLEGAGYYYAPTVLTNVPRDTRAGCEELFGPVAVVEVVEDLDEAIAVANSTPWGLGGSIWATDRGEIDRAIEGVEAGMVFANALVASTPELPFGGIKKSGYGRELSVLGIREFTNAKTFYIA